MATKGFLVCIASALLVQSVYGQLSCGNSLIQPTIQVPNQVQLLQNQVSLGNQLGYNNIGYNNAALGNSLGLNNIALGNQIGLNNIALGNNIGLNNIALGNNIGGAFYNGLGYNTGVSGLTVEALPGTFNVVSGSPTYAYPGGVSVTSNNEIGGIVTVTGGLPFAGSAYFDGSVASSGQAGLSYSTGQGVGLSSSGCGYGLAGTQYVGLGNQVGAGLINANSLNSGYNVINSGLSYAAPSTCGCI